MMNIWEMLIKPVTDVAIKGLDKIAMDAGEKKKLEMEIQKNMAAALQTEENSFRQFVLDYEGAAKDMPRIIQIMRGSVRPLLTYLLAGFWIYGYWFTFSHPLLPEVQAAQIANVMKLLYTLNVITLGFWFGERIITRTGLVPAIFNRKNGGSNDAE